jgi:heptaprenyl diphosphate synthase
MNVLSMYMRFQSDLKVIEHRLMHAFDDEQTTLKASALHLLKAGGKRLRPMLVLLAGRFGEVSVERVADIAVPLEMIHMATLVHDDVIDESHTRRGQPTVMAKWDSRVAMYTGDYLFARSLQLAAAVQQQDVHVVLSEAIMQMCKGEFEQMRRFFDAEQPLISYWRRIKRKTALLIAVSCRLGAMVSGAPERVAAQLYRIGYEIGMAFQMIDDLLDLTGTEEQIGKPPGNDLRQGNLTLPVLMVLREPQWQGQARALLQRIEQHADESAVQEMIQLVRASGTIERTRQIAEQTIERARRRIESLPARKEREDLMQLTEFVLQRKN